MKKSFEYIHILLNCKSIMINIEILPIIFISAPLRMLKNGCFDPIQKTQTVNARCNTDRHCQFLENTECIPSYQDIGIKTCRCKKGTLPKPAIKDTGLVPGCEETEFTQLLTVDSCRRIFTLGAYTVEYFNIIFNQIADY